MVKKLPKTKSRMGMEGESKKESMRKGQKQRLTLVPMMMMEVDKLFLRNQKLLNIFMTYLMILLTRRR